MRLFYLIGAILLGLVILVVSFAQVGATCTWYLISATSPAFIVLLQVAFLGAIMGALIILFFKTPKPIGDDEEPEMDSIE